MKKFLSWSLAFLVFLSPLTALAETDVSSMDTDALTALLKEITQELTARGFKHEEVTVPQGSYTIGEDIPAGAYALKSSFALVSIYTSTGSVVDMYLVSDGEVVGKVTLEDGQRIDITSGSVIFSPYTGIAF